MKKTGIELISQERKEQIYKHGRTVEHDVENHDSGQLAEAAKAVIGYDYLEGDAMQFPFYWDKYIVRKMCDKQYKDRLIIAGALIAAEIDRLQALEDSHEENV